MGPVPIELGKADSEQLSALPSHSLVAGVFPRQQRLLKDSVSYIEHRYTSLVEWTTLHSPFFVGYRGMESGVSSGVVPVLPPPVNGDEGSDIPSQSFLFGSILAMS